MKSEKYIPLFLQVSLGFFLLVGLVWLLFNEPLKKGFSSLGTSLSTDGDGSEQTYDQIAEGFNPEKSDNSLRDIGSQKWQDAKDQGSEWFQALGENSKAFLGKNRMARKLASRFEGATFATKSYEELPSEIREQLISDPGNSETAPLAARFAFLELVLTQTQRSNFHPVQIDDIIGSVVSSLPEDVRSQVTIESLSNQRIPSASYRRALHLLRKNRIDLRVGLLYSDGEWISESLYHLQSAVEFGHIPSAHLFSALSVCYYLAKREPIGDFDDVIEYMNSIEYDHKHTTIKIPYGPIQYMFGEITAEIHPDLLLALAHHCSFSFKNRDIPENSLKRNFTRIIPKDLKQRRRLSVSEHKTNAIRLYYSSIDHSGSFSKTLSQLLLVTLLSEDDSLIPSQIEKEFPSPSQMGDEDDFEDLVSNVLKMTPSKEDEATAVLTSYLDKRRSTRAAEELRRKELEAEKEKAKQLELARQEHLRNEELDKIRIQKLPISDRINEFMKAYGTALTEKSHNLDSFYDQEGVYLDGKKLITAQEAEEENNQKSKKSLHLSVRVGVIEKSEHQWVEPRLCVDVVNTIISSRKYSYSESEENKYGLAITKIEYLCFSKTDDFSKLMDGDFERFNFVISNNGKGSVDVYYDIPSGEADGISGKIKEQTKVVVFPGDVQSHKGAPNKENLKFFFPKDLALDDETIGFVGLVPERFLRPPPTEEIPRALIVDEDSTPSEKISEFIKEYFRVASMRTQSIAFFFDEGGAWHFDARKSQREIDQEHVTGMVEKYFSLNLIKLTKGPTNTSRADQWSYRTCVSAVATKKPNSEFSDAISYREYKFNVTSKGLKIISEKVIAYVYLDDHGLSVEKPQVGLIRGSDAANLRSEPSTDSDASIVEKIQPGTPVKFWPAPVKLGDGYSSSIKWVFVVTADGVGGLVAQNLVEPF